MRHSLRRRTMAGVAGLALAALGMAVPARAAGGTLAEASALLREFVKPGADHAALSARLRPAAQDYAAVFAPEAAARLKAAYEPAWTQGVMVVKGKPGQTSVLVWPATSDDIRAWRGNARDHFPGGYQKVGPHLKPGVTLYAFKFVVPGESLGMAFDGLVHVNGRWVIFPKPFRALE